MRKEIQFVLTIMGLGASLVVYAHATFATKETVGSIREILVKIDERVFDIYKHYKSKEY